MMVSNIYILLTQGKQNRNMIRKDTDVERCQGCADLDDNTKPLQDSWQMAVGEQPVGSPQGVHDSWVSIPEDRQSFLLYVSCPG